jgi:heat shock protein HslJ/membrane-bound inhibitor of C-type lysozyme
MNPVPPPGRAVLIGALAALAACGAAAAETRVVTGSLVPDLSAALPEDALAVVELVAADGTLVAEARLPAGGGTGPVEFALSVPGRAQGQLSAAVFSGGRAVLASLPLEVPRADDGVALGPVVLDAFQATALATRMRCGPHEVAIAFAADAARLKARGIAVALVPDVAASGARYIAPGDPGTWVWSKGNAATVSIAGTALPECAPAPAAPLFPLQARGHDPSWQVAIAGGQVRVTGQDGAAPLALPLPPAEASPGVLRYLLSPDLAVAIADAPCRDAQSGLPHPLAVTLTEAGVDRPGCGGDPLALLAGGTWRVEHLAPAGLPDGAEVTIAVGRDGRIAGRSGCNRYVGGLLVSEAGLRVGPLAVTRMACVPALMEAESRVLAALAAVEGFEIAPDGALRLISGDGVLMVARR